jgi:Na+/H+-dicarboxylate symporter
VPVAPIVRVGGVTADVTKLAGLRNLSLLVSRLIVKLPLMTSVALVIVQRFTLVVTPGTPVSVDKLVSVPVCVITGMFADLVYAEVVTAVVNGRSIVMLVVLTTVAITPH